MAVQGFEKGLYYVIDVGSDFSVKNLFDVKKEVEHALMLDHMFVVFDLSTCMKFDSSALGLVANLGKKLSAKTGRTGLLKPSNEIRELLSVSDVTSFVKIYKTEEEVEADS